MLAAHLASEAALRLLKPGHETYEVTETVTKIAKEFKCNVSLILSFKANVTYYTYFID